MNIVIAPFAYITKIFQLFGDALTQNSLFNFFK